VGDVNQRIFVEKHAECFAGPFLEVGSKDYGNTQDLRGLFPEAGQYVGVDMEDGPGVDVVLDLAGDFEDIDAKLQGRRFGTIFCLSVLEHCEQPFRMAENLTRLLAPAGCLCISVPFAWRIHAYPNDYWRFTPAGVRKLFPALEFDAERCAAATSKPGQFKLLDDDLGKIFFSFNRHRKEGHLLRGIFAELLRWLARIGLLGWLAGYRHVFAPTTVLMIGRRKECADDGPDPGRTG